APDGRAPELLFTENETNVERLFGGPNPGKYVKDAFHARVVEGRAEAVNPLRAGTKAAAWFRLNVPPGGEAVLKLRLRAESSATERPFGPEFDSTFAKRIRDADAFHASAASPLLNAEEKSVTRQAYAGLLWSKQFYHYIVLDWLNGDPAQPAPPAARKQG